MKELKILKIGDVVTVQTQYGSLPGTHRGTIVGRIGPWWSLSVWVPCRGRHEIISFDPRQVVGDDTPTTDLSLSAYRRFMEGMRRAQEAHALWE